jgi:hypothetical protein
VIPPGVEELRENGGGGWRVNEGVEEVELAAESRRRGKIGADGNWAIGRRREFDGRPL